MRKEEFLLHAELEDSHWWFRARRRIIMELFRRYLPADGDRQVVEIGCGTGGNLKELGKSYRVQGIDLSPDAIAFASGRVSCPLQCGDFRTVLRDAWGDIDGVLIADVLEHVPDDRGFLAEIVHSLKPGGIVVITVPACPFLGSRHDEVLGHLRRYRAESLRGLWRHLPVRERAFSPFNFFLFPAVACARIFMGQGMGESAQSSLKPVNPLLNALLGAVFGLERAFVGRSVTLPFGVSLLAVLEKTGPGGEWRKP